MKYLGQLSRNRTLCETQGTWERLKGEPSNKLLPGMTYLSASRHSESEPESFMRSLAAWMSNESPNPFGTGDPVKQQ